MGRAGHTDCFFNLSTTQKIDLFRRRRGLLLDTVYKTYFGKLMLPLALLGTCLTILFLGSHTIRTNPASAASTYRAIRARRVSRKCYVLLFNRTIGDLMSCIVALHTVAYVLIVSEVNRDIVMTLESFFVGSFWSAMVSYCSLSMLKVPLIACSHSLQLYAVWKPLQYRRIVTMRRCVYLIVLSWLVFLLISAYTLGVMALVKVDCKLETCLRSMYRSRNFATVCIFVITVVVFVVTALLVRRARAFSTSFRSSRDSTSSESGSKLSIGARFPMWKLGLNILTFAGLYVFYAIWCVGLILNTDQCYFQRNYAEMIRILAFVRLTLVLRICIDPILSFFTDFQIRRSLLQLLGIKGRISFITASAIFKRENTTEDTTTAAEKQRDNPVQRSSSVKSANSMTPQRTTRTGSLNTVA